MALPVPYHHGGLRAVLIDTAIEEIERAGYEGLSLRRLAAAAGVSHGAPYRHFASREALLLDVALNYANRLLDAYEIASVRHTEPRDQLREMCGAYTAAAVDRPQVFRLVFTSDIVLTEPPDSPLIQCLYRSFALFNKALATISGITVARRLDRAALSAWSTLHGLAMLRISGRFLALEHGDQTDDALLGEAIDDLVRGLPDPPTGQNATTD